MFAGPYKVGSKLLFLKNQSPVSEKCKTNNTLRIYNNILFLLKKFDFIFLNILKLVSIFLRCDRLIPHLLWRNFSERKQN